MPGQSGASTQDRAASATGAARSILPITAEQKALVGMLIQIARSSGAIDDVEAAGLRQRDQVGALLRLADLNNHATSPELNAAFKATERQIVTILSLDNQAAEYVTRLLVDMRSIGESHQETLRLAAQARQLIDAEKLEPVIYDYSVEAQHRAGIRYWDLTMVASRIFAQFARHVLEFVPVVEPDFDPFSGPKPWMFTDYGPSDEGIPVQLHLAEGS